MHHLLSLVESIDDRREEMISLVDSLVHQAKLAALVLMSIADEQNRS